MSDYDEIGEALARSLQQRGIDAHRYDPEQCDYPTLTVYDGNGDVVWQRKVGPLPPYTGPTVTVRLEHSPEDGTTWTELPL